MGDSVEREGQIKETEEVRTAKIIFSLIIPQGRKVQEKMTLRPAVDYRLKGVVDANIEEALTKRSKRGQARQKVIAATDEVKRLGIAIDEIGDACRIGETIGRYLKRNKGARYEFERLPIDLSTL
ncbi:hypothetical protein A2Z22_04380 [Candidatus Woesebacteria bacterium RBG_16_34_12]|uniref:Uncharacterized protein n=1 Tax=Candidatus Woesebacteria bacterium RBG_16_34_12 TaxID=1802480 RepID=A0A1F7XBK2_9BACT|nr:MAG: hypothetical protein A2Z22_04380 [Candidatus Woesebacteria bacterium RBG_16_34_12]